MICHRALLAAAALSCALSLSAAELTVTTYTASEAGFLVNSHLIAGEHDAILVDAQFLRSEAGKATEWVKASGKHLKYIFVTHGHPDHFFGLEVLQREFPDARIVADSAVIPDIQAVGPKAIAFWKPTFKDEIPDSFVTPQPVNATSLFVDGQEIQLLRFGPGESPHATVLWIPATQALLTGDLTYNKVHLWLRENRPEEWLAILDRLQGLQPASVYPGHGQDGGPEIIAADREYIGALLAATAPPATKQQAIATLKSRYPDYALPMIVEFSVSGRLGR